MKIFMTGNDISKGNSSLTPETLQNIVKTLYNLWIHVEHYQYNATHF